jgi:hypothetical protein
LLSSQHTGKDIEKTIEAINATLGKNKFEEVFKKKNY